MSSFLIALQTNVSRGNPKNYSSNTNGSEKKKKNMSGNQLFQIRRSPKKWQKQRDQTPPKKIEIESNQIINTYK